MTRRTISFESQGWGHAVSIWNTYDNGLTVQALGHSRDRFQRNDYLVFKESRYLVKSVEWKTNPTDMFEAQLVFWPRIPVGISVRVTKENNHVAIGAIGITAPEQEALSAVYVEFPELGIVGFPSVDFVEAVADED